MPTLNAMDNSGDAFATVLILMEQGKPVIMRNREGCVGGGKGPMYSDKSFTLATSNDQIVILGVDIYNAAIDQNNFHTIRATEGITAHPSVLIIDGTRVDDVRVYEDGIMPTVISRYGTGGGNVPMVYEQQKVVAPTLSASNNHPGSFQASEVTAQIASVVEACSVVRRLTPTECERLQGFPDGWTEGQADSNRYKQMGNAVAVPVVQWIIDRMVAND